MTHWIIDSKAVTYPDGKLKRVVFRKSDAGEIQINELADIDVLGIPVDEAIQVLTEAKAQLVEPVLLADTHVDTSKETIVDIYIDGWRAELSEFEKGIFAVNE
jgi:hypothetical protein